MKHLLIVRHALPHEGHPTRPHDPPLHADGRRHALRLAHKLKREGIDRIVSSPQQRALDTAAPLARMLGLRTEVFEGLAEIDRHTDRYRSVETMRAEEPERWDEFVASPVRFFGRDPAEFRADVARAYRAIVEEPGGTRIAVFTHGMTTKTILSVVLGQADTRYTQFSIAHGSVTRLSGTTLSAMRIDSLNETLCSARGTPP
jgi:2,3-bisphosphoglycerate-dependent phosphoglycerate mutase